MAAFNRERDNQLNTQTIASWAYASNITDHNERLMNDASAEGAKFIKVSQIEDIFLRQMYKHVLDLKVYVV